MKSARILIINPGSTTTKFAVYDNTVCTLLKTLHHSMVELARFKTITDQYDFRKKLILDELSHDQINLETLNIVIGRGGLTYPLKSGVYVINELMLAHCRAGVMGEHACNLGALIAHEIAQMATGAIALVADPVVTDELDEIARVSGHPLFRRRSIFHALNQKAVARQHAAKIGRQYEELDLIVVHLGGGITIGAHHLGRVIDVNNGLDGEGPFSPERSGTLPAGALIEICYSKKHSRDEVYAMVSGQGGLVAYLGTNDAREVEMRITDGDQEAIFYLRAMGYQVAKAIGEMATVLKGKIDGILITGGIAYDKVLMAQIRERVEFIAPVSVYPGQDEIKALAMNALMVARGEVEANIYDKTGN